MEAEGEIVLCVSGRNWLMKGTTRYWRVNKPSKRWMDDDW